MRLKIKTNHGLVPELSGMGCTLISQRTVSASPKSFEIFKVKLDKPVTLHLTSIWERTKDEIELPEVCFEKEGV